jgi:hypothetical protein
VCNLSIEAIFTNVPPAASVSTTITTHWDKPPYQHRPCVPRPNSKFIHEFPVTHIPQAFIIVPTLGSNETIIIGITTSDILDNIHSTTIEQ